MFAPRPLAPAAATVPSSSPGSSSSNSGNHLPPGVGQIHLSSTGQLSTLAFAYPLKLISPTPLTSSTRALRVVYLLSYGGGLVGGDRVWLDVNVDEAAKLVLLTQGTTKVFRSRPTPRLASSSPSAHGHLPPTDLQASTTRQQLIAHLAPEASLFLLPSPTSCFARARFTQRQRVNLPVCGSASVVVLDWFNSGRTATTSSGPVSSTSAGMIDNVGGGGEGGGGGGGESTAELWAAERIEFYLELWWGPHRGLLERLVLSSASGPSLAPYTLFGTVVLAGPAVQTVIGRLLVEQAREARITRSLRERPAFMWSLSIVEPRVEGMAGGPSPSSLSSSSASPPDPASSSSSSSSSFAASTPAPANPPVPANKTAVLRICAVEAEVAKDWLAAALGPGKGGLAELVGEEMWDRAMG